MITNFKIFESNEYFVYAINSGDEFSKALKKDTKYQVIKITLEWDDNIYFTLEGFPNRMFKKDRFITEDEYLANKYNI